MTGFYTPGRRLPAVDSDDAGGAHTPNSEPRLKAAVSGGYPRDWYLAGNEIAKRIPRTGVTPWAELGIAAANYDRARDALEQYATVANWDQLHEQLYATGREYERAIQVARFGRVTGTGGGDWKRGLRR